MQQSSEPTYYSLLGLHPSASAIEIRRAYRELSKCYHPDTTKLPTAIAIAKFQQLNEAYATLSNPERRFSYDLKIGYSRFGVIQAPSDLDRPVSNPYDWSKSAYLDASDRPLSAGEIFALFILGLTLLGCLLLAIAIGLTRGEGAFQTNLQPTTPVIQQRAAHISQPISNDK
ncbi:J domain-containing protein [Scytonema sp. NUACC21]